MSDWIDAHCHLTDSRFDGNLEQVLNNSRQAGVRVWIQGGVSPDDWEKQVKLREALGPTRALVSFGLHPWWVIQSSQAEIEQGLKLLKQRLLEADGAGEMGLDLSERSGGREKLGIQAEAFVRQVAIAREMQKPLILHIVQAHSQAIEILEKNGPYPAGGLVHSFSASRETAERYLKMGFLLSISGVATKPGFQTLKKALNWLPPDRLVLETDSPDQPPTGVVGLNEPYRLVEIAQAVGAIRGESAESLLNRSAANLRRVFRSLQESV